jgi:hypothetical protein
MCKISDFAGVGQESKKCWHHFTDQPLSAHLGRLPLPSLQGSLPLHIADPNWLAKRVQSAPLKPARQSKNCAMANDFQDPGRSLWKLLAAHLVRQYHYKGMQT